EITRGAGVITAVDEGALEVVTAKHVVFEEGGAFRATNVILKGNGRRFSATSPRVHGSLDLAVLIVPLASPAPLVGPGRFCPKGNDVSTSLTMLGNPPELGARGWNKASRHQVRRSATDGLLHFEAHGFDRGFSGGGAFNADGQLVGVVVERDGSAGYAIPI